MFKRLCKILLKAVFFRSREGEPPEKVLKDQIIKSQEILIPASEVSLKHTHQNFHGGQIAEHIHVTETHIR